MLSQHRDRSRGVRSSERQTAVAASAPAPIALVACARAPTALASRAPSPFLSPVACRRCPGCLFACRRCPILIGASSKPLSTLTPLRLVYAGFRVPPAICRFADQKRSQSRPRVKLRMAIPHFAEQKRPQSRQHMILRTIPHVAEQKRPQARPHMKLMTVPHFAEQKRPQSQALSFHSAHAVNFRARN